MKNRGERDDEDGRRLQLAALDTVDGLSAASNQTALTALLATAFAKFGIDHFVITGLPRPYQRFENVVMMRLWPRGWYETYAAENFVRADPVIRMCRRTVLPFEWDEAPYEADREPEAARVMTSAHDFGLCRGFSIPVHGLQGFEACFSVSGRTPDFDRRTKPILHLIAMYGFERARVLAHAGTLGAVNPLTTKEREVLTWAAMGKSHAEIAALLGVTIRTVTAHTIAAATKLGAANRTQAVVRAMQHDFIAP